MRNLLIAAVSGASFCLWLALMLHYGHGHQEAMQLGAVLALTLNR